MKSQTDTEVGLDLENSQYEISIRLEKNLCFRKFFFQRNICHQKFLIFDKVTPHWYRYKSHYQRHHFS